ncbi:DUF167 domain-containing protein [Oceanicaulis sp. MMSF_3324]|uniref:DUF167 domain-containing protein n=1 Tax=Oceanicaulis sp. MMSF_3324 TaxID=3046702 RepID=UPI00273FB8B1|nr:DUF167 domain-containing protein [Oceanicaulis sp. MMSF_3324]
MPAQTVEDGLRLFVRVQPKAARAHLGGGREGADGRVRLVAKVRSAPDKGAANTELCALIAKALGVPKSTVSVIAGATQREKTLLVRTAATNPLLDVVSGLLHHPGS